MAGVEQHDEKKKGSRSTSATLVPGQILCVKRENDVHCTKKGC
jgi:hypothetical protein